MRPVGTLCLSLITIVFGSFALGSGFESLNLKDRFPNGLENARRSPVALLGSALFFDQRLSRGDQVSCASCHKPEFGFSDPVSLSKGVHGDSTKRHTPHLLNLEWARLLFWDGRARSLEEQVLTPIQNEVEMDLELEELVQKLSASEFYRESFVRAFGDTEITEQRIAEALATFIRTLVSFDSKFDRFIAGDEELFGESEKRGLALFTGKAKCIVCHFGPNLTDKEFHFTGVIGHDPGRGAIDRHGRREFDITPYPFFAGQGAMKTPGLRDVSKTAPYMHNGSEASLHDVIDHYNQGGRSGVQSGLAKGIQPLGLDEKEKEDLVAFLRTLTGKLVFEKVEAK